MFSLVKSWFVPKNVLEGRGGGQVVSELAFYSDNPSSNPVNPVNL